MSKLHPQIARLADRYKTHAVGPTHEFHNLSTLARRLCLSQNEALEHVEDGSLLALAGPTNGKYLFSSTALSTMRNRVIDFVASEIASELASRGVEMERIEMAVQRGLARQHDLSRVDNVIEFDDNNGGFVNGVGTGVGIAAAGLGGLAAYRYWKGRRNPDGTPMLPPGSSADDYAPSPKPDAPSGIERHPGPPMGARPITTASPAPNVASQTAGQIAGQDALSQAVRQGKQAIAARGSSILRAIRGAL